MASGRNSARGVVGSGSGGGGGDANATEGPFMFSGYVTYTGASNYWGPNTDFGISYGIWNSLLTAAPNFTATGYLVDRAITINDVCVYYRPSQDDTTNQCKVTIIRHRKTYGTTTVANADIVAETSLNHASANVPYIAAVSGSPDTTLTLTANTTLAAGDMIIPVINGSSGTSTNVRLGFAFSYTDV